MSEKTHDAIVLGSGPAGEVAAGRLADEGWKVAIIERDLVGGECSYYACMPSKALLRPADVLAEAKRIPGLPIDPDAELDPPAVLARRDAVIHDEDDSGQLPWLEERGIDLFRGAGRIVGEGRVALVTSAYHMPRALQLAARAGLDAGAFPTDYQVVPETRLPWDNWLPSIGGLGQSNIAIREIAALNLDHRRSSLDR